MAVRRRIEFASLHEVVPEVERLLAGHATVGNWSLGQICKHLSKVFDALVDGGPNKKPPSRVLRAAQWCCPKWFFSTSGFPTGIRIPTTIVMPEPGSRDPRLECERLRAALGRFVAAPGPFPTHPYIGIMSKPEWDEFNRRHCAHHLGFAVPR